MQNNGRIEFFFLFFVVTNVIYCVPNLFIYVFFLLIFQDFKIHFRNVAILNRKFTGSIFLPVGILLLVVWSKECFFLHKNMKASKQKFIKKLLINKKKQVIRRVNNNQISINKIIVDRTSRSKFTLFGIVVFVFVLLIFSCFAESTL